MLLVDRVEVLPLIERANYATKGLKTFPVLFEFLQEDDSYLRTEGGYTLVDSGQEFFNYGNISGLIKNEHELKILKDTIREEIERELRIPLIPLREWKCDSCKKKVIDSEGVVEFFLFKEENRFLTNGPETTYSHGFHIVHRGKCQYSNAYLERHNVVAVHTLDLDAQYGSKSAFFWGLYEDSAMIRDIEVLRDITKRVMVPYYELARKYPERLAQIELPSFQKYNRALLRYIVIEKMEEVDFHY